MRVCFFFLFVLLSSSISFCSAQKNIFILAGQSNMAGRGGIDDTTQIWDGVVPPECEPDPAILRLDARLAWAEAREPLHVGIDAGGVVGVGPGIAFARSVLTGLGPVGLVPCAMGGTNISHWAKGSALYRRMLHRARAVVGVRDGNEIRALLWYQGESDTVVEQDAKNYGRRLEKLFDDIRMDLNSPMLPIIQVALASGEGRYVDTVREAQFSIDLLNVRTVDAMGLALRADRLHLTSESQVRLGKMMADAFLNFLPSHISASNNAINTSTFQASSSTTSSNIFSKYMILLSIFIFSLLFGI